MTVIVFKPKATADAQQRLRDWVAFARRNQPFGRHFEWDLNEWDLTVAVEQRAAGNRRYRVHFSSLRDTTGSRRNKADFLRPPFLDFAKAVISETHRLRKLKEYQKLLSALRALEDALLEAGDTGVASATALVFDSAANRLRRLTDPWSVGKCLESVADLLDQLRLTAAPLQWRSPFKYKKPGRSDALETTDDWRSSKLPDIRSILALAEVNHSSQSPIDRAVTAWVTLALYAPSRCSEILSLPVDCWTELNDGDESVDVLRWRPSKGGDPMVKLASGANSLEAARCAVDFLEQIGRTARQAARWYLENPGMLYLPTGYEHLRGHELTLPEISQILGASNATRFDVRGKGIQASGRTTDVARSCGKPWATTYAFSDVERYVLSLLPPAFPWHDKFTGLCLHEALFVVPRGFFRPDVVPMAHVPQPVSISMINHQLGSNPDGRTVFSRNGKCAPDGLPWKITSHQVRHLLNTLAQSKYLPQSLIALWSGRANEGQNSWYDHTSPEVHIESYLNIIDGSDVPVIGPLQETITARQKIALVSARDVLREEIGALHVTKYGLCRHNYALTPCPKQKDCATCGENLFVKGDPKNHAEALRMVSVLSMAVRNAFRAKELGEPGAQRWLDLNEPRLERWKEILRIHEDATISDGTICTLPHLSAPQSEVGFTLAAREAPVVDEEQSIDLMMGLLE